MTNVILDELLLVFPEKETVLRSNAIEYLDKLSKLDDKYTELTIGKTKTVVVADKFPFSYLMNDYGINYLGAYTGCSVDTEASFEMASKLVSKVNEENLNYICVIDKSDRKIANMVVSECNNKVEILELDSIQGISRDQLNTSYLGIMENNLKVLEKVLLNEAN